MFWLYWFIQYWAAGLRIIADIKKSTKLTASGIDSGLLILIALFTFVLIVTGVSVSLGYGMSYLLTHRVRTTLMGVLITFAGMVGTFYCRSYLGHFWTAEVALQTNHQVVEGGPYGFVRHPAYTAAILMYLGTGLVFPTWWNILIIMGVTAAYAIKAVDEERFLAANLTGYPAYQKRVPYRLIPWIW